MDWKRWFKKPNEKKPDGLLLGLERHGHKFYIFDSIFYVPVRRQKVFQISLANYGRNMTEIDQQDHALLNTNLIDAEDLKGLRTVNETYKGLISLDATTKMTIEVANPIILIDDEPLNEISQEHMKLKGKLCEQHEDIEDFFLTIGIAYINHTVKQLNDTQFLDYLKNPANRIRERLFFDQIGRNIWTSSLVESTSK